MTKAVRYAVGKVVFLGGEEWEVLSHEGTYTRIYRKRDGEERTVSNFSIHHSMEHHHRERARRNRTGERR